MYALAKGKCCNEGTSESWVCTIPTHPCTRRACAVGQERGLCTTIPLPAKAQPRPRPASRPAPPGPGPRPLEGAAEVRGAVGTSGRSGAAGTQAEDCGKRPRQGHHSAGPEGGQRPAGRRTCCARARGEGLAGEVSRRESGLRLLSPCSVPLLATVGFELRSLSWWGLEDKAYKLTGVGGVGGARRQGSQPSPAGGQGTLTSFQPHPAHSPDTWTQLWGAGEKLW